MTAQELSGWLLAFLLITNIVFVILITCGASLILALPIIGIIDMIGMILLFKIKTLSSKEE